MFNDLTQPDGLSLSSGFLYVEGDASIAGGLTGTGYVYATGSIDISGRVEVYSPYPAFAARTKHHIYRRDRHVVHECAGSLTQVAVAGDGTVVGVNAQGQIFQYQADPGWASIPGSLVQIAVGSSTAIWGINAQQQIYRWDSTNSKWVNVPGH